MEHKTNGEPCKCKDCQISDLLEEVRQLQEENKRLAIALGKKQTRSGLCSGTAEETLAAIDRSDRGMDPEYKKVGLEELEKLARANPELVSADLRDALDLLDVQTHDLRAIGALMLAGERAGWIRKSGRRYRNRHTHGDLSNIWTSLIYSGVRPLPGCGKFETVEVEESTL